MDRRQIYKYILKRLQQKFPAYDFSEHSIISKLIAAPWAAVFEDIFDLLTRATDIDDETIRLLQAKLYGLNVEERKSEAGLVELEPTGTTDISIPQGTTIIELESGATGFVAEKIQLSKDEIISMLARGKKPKIPFIGNLPLGSVVSFGDDIGEYKTARVVKEYSEELFEPPEEALKELLSNRPLLYGDSTRVAIEKKLSAFNAKVIDPMNPKNPILLFNKKKTISKYMLISYDEETHEIKEVDTIIEAGTPLIFYGIEITP